MEQYVWLCEYHNSPLIPASESLELFYSSVSLEVYGTGEERGLDENQSTLILRADFCDPLRKVRVSREKDV